MHGRGASDSYIAGRFARRTTSLAVTGGAIGTIVSVPLLLTLCRLAAPFAAPPGALPAAPSALDSIAAPGLGSLELLLDRLPLPLWIALPLLPVMAAAIGWCTAQATVRTWLRRLP